MLRDVPVLAPRSPVERAVEDRAVLDHPEAMRQAMLATARDVAGPDGAARLTAFVGDQELYP